MNALWFIGGDFTILVVHIYILRFLISHGQGERAANSLDNLREVKVSQRKSESNVIYL
jgi:hypothetical protein